MTTSQNFIRVDPYGQVSSIKKYKLQTTFSNTNTLLYCFHSAFTEPCNSLKPPNEALTCP